MRPLAAAVGSGIAATAGTFVLNMMLSIVETTGLPNCAFQVSKSMPSSCRIPKILLPD